MAPVTTFSSTLQGTETMSRSSSNTLFFYQGDKLITVKQGDQNRTIFRNADMPLAEQQTGEASGTGLLATDDKGSVLSVQDEDSEEDHHFAAYGHDPTLPSKRTTIGFNGEAFEPASTSYLLGLGYRSYSPHLRRFFAADNWSPFGKGGLNAYCYCEGDPINFIDPTGQMMRRVVLPNGQTFKVNKNMAVAIGPPTVRTPPKRSLSPASQHAQTQWRQPGRSDSSPHIASQPPTDPQIANVTMARRNPSPATINAQTHDSSVASPASSRDSTPSGSRSPSPEPPSPLPHHVRSWTEVQKSPFSSRASHIRQPTDEVPRAPSSRY
jgi:RHS repeat-associated protein